MLNDFEKKAACDRLEGWELIEFLQIPTEDILQAAQDYDWINDDNVEDVRELIGLKQ